VRNFLILLTIFWVSSSRAAIVDLTDDVAPVIEGDTLYFRGKIDGMMYDFLAMNAAQMREVKVIDLLSYGGDLSMALDVAAKIKDLHKITRVSAGGFCMSACTVLFAAGDERQMAQDAVLGIHAARPGGAYAKDFNDACKKIGADAMPVIDENLPECQKTLAAWYAVASRSTDKMFSFFESNGVSTELRADYFAMPLVEVDWDKAFNVMRLPDWILDSTTARDYGFATSILPL